MRLARSVLVATGPQAGDFLQGQLSQDILAIDTGESSWSWLLQPNGKALAIARVTRVTIETFWIDVESVLAEEALARLMRFLLRMHCELTIAPDLEVWGVRGPLAGTAAVGIKGSDIVRVAAGWPGIGGVDVIGRDLVVPPSLRLVGAEAWNGVRIEAGVAQAPNEINESVIPAELGSLDATVSFTKGCYVGQELVARIDSRGHVNRWLAAAVLADSVLPPVGAEVVVDGHAVGVVTSVAESLDLRAPIALVWVRREVGVADSVELRWPTGSASASVHERPLVGAS